MKKWIFEGTLKATKGTLSGYKIDDQASAYIDKILGDRKEAYIRVNIWTDGSVDFFEEVDVQGSKIADLPPEVEDGIRG